MIMLKCFLTHLQDKGFGFIVCDALVSQGYQGDVSRPDQIGISWITPYLSDVS